MVWIELIENSVSAYFDVTKICAITGTLKEKTSESQNRDYILEGLISLHTSGLLSTPIAGWDYNFGIPKINKKIKNLEKQKEEIDKWKHQAFQNAKMKHDKRVFRVVHCINEVKNQKEEHVAFNFTKFLKSIDSENYLPIFLIK
jgi:hypothetical protein